MAGILVNKLYDFKGHRDCVYALEKGSQPNLFFSAGGDGMVAGWNMDHPDQGTLVAKVPNSVYALHYLPAKNILAVGHNQDGVHFVDVKSNKEVASLKLTNHAIFEMVSFGELLFAGTGDGSIFVVDLRSHKSIKRISASDQSVRCLAINTATNELAAGYSDSHIRIFSLEDFSLKKEWAAHENSVFTLRYSPDHNFLISGSRDARLKRWEVANQYNKNEEVVAHLYTINNMAFSPDGKHFITCSIDKTIKVWNAGDMKLLKVLDRARHAGHGTSVNKVLWLSDHRIVSGSDDRNVYVWDIHFENLKQISKE
jgi:WD40 repeat protein